MIANKSIDSSSMLVYYCSCWISTMFFKYSVLYIFSYMQIFTWRNSL